MDEPPATDTRPGDTTARQDARAGLLSTVSNAARVLKAFRDGEGELGVSELSRRLGLGKSNIHRVLTTLVAEGLLVHEPNTRTYRLSLVLCELGEAAKANVNLHTAATPILEELRNTTGETVQVAVLDGTAVVYVERLESSHTLRLFTQIGRRMPAHATSTGKLLLAFLPDEEREAFFTDGPTLEARTPYTITDHDALREELQRIRQRGWSENAQESEVGVASVGFPIRDASGRVVAAVSIAGPVMRLDGDSLRRFANVGVEGAKAISRRLGWTEDLEAETEALEVEGA